MTVLCQLPNVYVTLPIDNAINALYIIKIDVLECVVYQSVHTLSPETDQTAPETRVKWVVCTPAKLAHYINMMCLARHVCQALVSFNWTSSRGSSV